MGYIVEDLDLSEISETIIEDIVELFSDYKLNNDDALEVISRVEEYFDEVKQYAKSEKGE